MITIKFNNHTIYFTQIHLENILESLQLQGINLSDYLKKYSFLSLDDLYNLIQNRNRLVIYYHQTVPEDFNILNPQNFETVLKGLEQLYIYQRDFPLLQMDFFPDVLTIYTYSQIWEDDFEKFQEAPNQKYDWDNLPKSLKTPNSNMHIGDYNPITHIATVYHYYTL